MEQKIGNPFIVCNFIICKVLTKDRKGAASCVVFYESLVFPRKMLYFSFIIFLAFVVFFGCQSLAVGVWDFPKDDHYQSFSNLWGFDQSRDRGWVHQFGAFSQEVIACIPRWVTLKILNILNILWCNLLGDNDAAVILLSNKTPQSSHCKFVSQSAATCWPKSRDWLEQSQASPNSKFQNCKTVLPPLFSLYCFTLRSSYTVIGGGIE